MRTVGVKELKDHLSRYLKLVKSGENILVTERGRVVARILPEGQAICTELQGLLEMAARGLVRLPRPGSDVQEFEPVEIRGQPLSSTVLEDRR